MTVETLLQKLINCPSISPNDAGCHQIIETFLADLKLNCQHIEIHDTKNLVLTHGSGTPVIYLVGHTDVVPAGDLASWQSPPFQASIRDGYLYGRGAADMKAGVAALTCAFRELIKTTPEHLGRLVLILTSDEEADSTHGIQAVLPILARSGYSFDYALVGEPTTQIQLGDVARQGRRGSLNALLTVHGKQGHVADSTNTCNPISGLGEIISALAAIHWDDGNANFPPTTCQFTNINAGVGAENVTPETACAQFNFRFNTEQTATGIIQRVEAEISRICAPRHLTASYQWRLSGEPFFTDNSELKTALRDAISTHCKRTVTFDTGGGTSDARFFAKYGAATIEFGVCNATMHQVNERVKLADLPKLVAIYRDTVRHLWAHCSSMLCNKGF